MLPPYDVDAVTIDLAEVDTMKIVLKDLFADEDNDSIFVALDASAIKLVKILTPTGKMSLMDTIRIVTSVTKDTSIIIAVYASDGLSDAVQVSYIVNVTDANRPPVAVDTS